MFKSILRVCSNENFKYLSKDIFPYVIPAWWHLHDSRLVKMHNVICGHITVNIVRPLDAHNNENSISDIKQTRYRIFYRRYLRICFCNNTILFVIGPLALRISIIVLILWVTRLWSMKTKLRNGCWYKHSWTHLASENFVDCDSKWPPVDSIGVAALAVLLSTREHFWRLVAQAESVVFS